MVSPSNRHLGAAEIERDRKTTENIKSILSDLVKIAAPKKDLQIAARALRLAKGLNLYDSSYADAEAILKGANKWNIDFIAALDESDA